MRLLSYLWPVLLSTLLAHPALAQTDTILRTNGEEVPARVLTISPTEISYASAAEAGKVRPDTLRLPTANVFLVRYANGTKELMEHLMTPYQPSAPLAKSRDLLWGLSDEQRFRRGQADAQAGFTGKKAFNGALGATLLLGPLPGLFSTAIISNSSVKSQHLGAPSEKLLLDYNYGRGYRQQAAETKRRRAWAGFGTGVGIEALLLVVVLAAAAGGH